MFRNVFVERDGLLMSINGGTYLQLIIAGSDWRRGNAVEEALKELSAFGARLLFHELVTLDNNI